MRATYIVEVINANAKKLLTTPNLEIAYSKRDKAVMAAGKWNTKGYTVVIHNTFTGERNIPSNNA